MTSYDFNRIILASANGVRWWSNALAVSPARISAYQDGREPIPSDVAEIMKKISGDPV